MSSWDDYRLTCFHGVREGLDSHPCPDCQVIAKAEGKDMSNGNTYIYVKDPSNKKEK